MHKADSFYSIFLIDVTLSLMLYRMIGFTCLKVKIKIKINTIRKTQLQALVSVSADKKNIHEIIITTS